MTRLLLVALAVIALVIVVRRDPLREHARTRRWSSAWCPTCREIDREAWPEGVGWTW